MDVSQKGWSSVKAWQCWLLAAASLSSRRAVFGSASTKAWAISSISTTGATCFWSRTMKAGRRDCTSSPGGRASTPSPLSLTRKKCFWKISLILLPFILSYSVPRNKKFSPFDVAQEITNFTPFIRKQPLSFNACSRIYVCIRRLQSTEKLCCWCRLKIKAVWWWFLVKMV